MADFSRHLPKPGKYTNLEIGKGHSRRSQKEFDLPVDRKNWPEVLIAKGTPVERVLDFVFEQLGPFVQMVLELYRFLSEWVSTAGGRTTHFEIRAEDMKFKLETFGYCNL